MLKINQVVIIDDDEIHNYLFSKRIKNVGISDNVTAFEKGEEALTYLQHGKDFPDIIFLDLQMLGLTGWEFLEKYDALFNGKIKEKVSIFMLSSSVFPADIEKAKNHPLITEYIKKPLMEDELFVIKDRYLNG
jgi:CheY-like chemotaxis protein